jgi:hypothetical protein
MIRLGKRSVFDRFIGKWFILQPSRRAELWIAVGWGTKPTASNRHIFQLRRCCPMLIGLLYFQYANLHGHHISSCFRHKKPRASA